ncbi:hypothetical protein ACLKA6_001533 [Drosophila palustris]
MASLERQSSDDEFLNCQTSAAPPMEQQNWPYPSDNLVGSLLNWRGPKNHQSIGISGVQANPWQQLKNTENMKLHTKFNNNKKTGKNNNKNIKRHYWQLHGEHLHQLWRQLKHPESYSSGRNMASLERQSSDDEFLNCQTSAAPPMEQQNWPYPSDNLVGSLLNWRGPKNHQSIGISGVQANPWQQLKNTENMKLHTKFNNNKKTGKNNNKNIKRHYWQLHGEHLHQLWRQLKHPESYSSGRNMASLERQSSDDEFLNCQTSAAPPMEQQNWPYPSDNLVGSLLNWRGPKNHQSIGISGVQANPWQQLKNTENMKLHTKFNNNKKTGKNNNKNIKRHYWQLHGEHLHQLWRQLKHPESYSSGRNMASLERQSSDDEFLNCQTSAAPPMEQQNWPYPSDNLVGSLLNWRGPKNHQSIGISGVQANPWQQLKNTENMKLHTKFNNNKKTGKNNNKNIKRHYWQLHGEHLHQLWRQLKHPESYSSGRNMASLERQSSDDEFLNCQTSAAPPMEQQNWPYPSDNLVGSLLNWRGPKNHQSIGISGVQANPWQQLKNTENMKLHTKFNNNKKTGKNNNKNIKRHYWQLHGEHLHQLWRQLKHPESYSSGRNMASLERQSSDDEFLNCQTSAAPPMEQQNWPYPSDNLVGSLLNWRGPKNHQSIGISGVQANPWQQLKNTENMKLHTKFNNNKKTGKNNNKNIKRHYWQLHGEHLHQLWRQLKHPESYSSGRNMASLERQSSDDEFLNCQTSAAPPMEQQNWPYPSDNLVGSLLNWRGPKNHQSIGISGVQANPWQQLKNTENMKLHTKFNNNKKTGKNNNKNIKRHYWQLHGEHLHQLWRQLKHPESYSSGRNMASLERQSSDDEFLNCQTSAAPPMEQQNWPYPSDNLVGSLLNWRGPKNHQSIGISGVQANPWQQLKNTENMKLHTKFNNNKKTGKNNNKNIKRHYWQLHGEHLHQLWRQLKHPESYSSGRNMASLERQSSDDEFLNCQTSAAPPMEQQNWPYPSDNLVGSLLNWRGPKNHQSIGISGVQANPWQQLKNTENMKLHTKFNNNKKTGKNNNKNIKRHYWQLHGEHLHQLWRQLKHPNPIPQEIPEMASLERQSSDDEFLNCQTSAAPPMEQQNWPYPSDNLVGSLLNWRGPKNHQSIGISGVQANPWQQLKNTENMKLHTKFNNNKKTGKNNNKNIKRHYWQLHGEHLHQLWRQLKHPESYSSGRNMASLERQSSDDEFLNCQTSAAPPMEQQNWPYPSDNLVGSLLNWRGPKNHQSIGISGVQANPWQQLKNTENMKLHTKFNNNKKTGKNNNKNIKRHYWQLHGEHLHQLWRQLKHPESYSSGRNMASLERQSSDDEFLNCQTSAAPPMEQQNWPYPSDNLVGSLLNWRGPKNHQSIGISGVQANPWQQLKNTENMKLHTKFNNNKKTGKNNNKNIKRHYWQLHGEHLHQLWRQLKHPESYSSGRNMASLERQSSDDEFLNCQTSAAPPMEQQNWPYPSDNLVGSLLNWRGPKNHQSIGISGVQANPWQQLKNTENMKLHTKFNNNKKTGKNNNKNIKRHYWQLHGEHLHQLWRQLKHPESYSSGRNMASLERQSSDDEFLNCQTSAAPPMEQQNWPYPSDNLVGSLLNWRGPKNHQSIGISGVQANPWQQLKNTENMKLHTKFNNNKKTGKNNNKNIKRHYWQLHGEHLHQLWRQLKHPESYSSGRNMASLERQSSDDEFLNCQTSAAPPMEQQNWPYPSDNLVGSLLNWRGPKIINPLAYPASRQILGSS